MAPTPLEQFNTVASWILDNGLAHKSQLVLDIPKLIAAWLRFIM